jgi:hypothetical protein
MYNKYSRLTEIHRQQVHGFLMTSEVPSHQQWLRNSFVQVIGFDLNMLVLKRTLNNWSSLKKVNQFVILFHYVIFCSTFCITKLLSYFCFAELCGLNISYSKDKEKESTQDTWRLSIETCWLLQCYTWCRFIYVATCIVQTHVFVIWTLDYYMV